MKRAADEAASSSSATHQSSIPPARAKIDGAWQKRGTSSKQSEIP